MKITGRAKPRSWLLVLAVTVSLGCWAADSSSPRGKLEIVTKYKTGDSLEASLAPRLRMGLRNDDNSIAKSTMSSEKSAAGPVAVNPMVLPPRQHRQPLVATPSSRDSYLDALVHSHRVGGAKSTIGPVYQRPEYTNSTDRQSSKIEAKHQVISRVSHGDKSYLTTLESLPYAHGAHKNRYQQLPHYYGQADDYDSYSYGPGIVVSSAPSSGSHYGPPGSDSQHQQGLGSLQATYSTSYPLPDLFPLASWPPIDLSWPLSIKINAYTFIKIILKLVIFKMIVKFIGAVCLLLFIPKLVHKKHEGNSSDDDDDDESRYFAGGLSFERLHALASQVAEALEHYGRRRDECSECKVGKSRRRSSGWTDAWNDNVDLFRDYLVEERQRMDDERN